jgi:hypothetical protein
MHNLYKDVGDGYILSREDCTLSASIIVSSFLLAKEVCKKKKKKKKNDADRQFVCPSCPKVFTSLDEHTVHIECHISGYQQKENIERE